MTPEEFWTLFDISRSADGSLAGLVRHLHAYLLRSGPQGVLAFRQQWNHVDEQLFTWPVWDAAALILGGVGEDAFGDVRAAVISFGRVVAEGVVADPDTLADLADNLRSLSWADAESLNLLVLHAWAELTGGHDLPRVPPSNGPHGPRTDLADRAAVRARFPRLAQASWPTQLP